MYKIFYQKKDGNFFNCGVYLGTSSEKIKRDFILDEEKRTGLKVFLLSDSTKKISDFEFVENVFLFDRFINLYFSKNENIKQNENIGIFKFF